MASRKPTSTNFHAPMYEQLLLFPERAEYLAEDRFDSYRVSLDHWKTLASTFREAFETVFERASARVLLVHGGQGHGKSLFVQTLEKDFKTSTNVTTVDPNNLWHALTGGTSPTPETIRSATQSTTLRRVLSRSGWLDDERNFAMNDTHRVRVFVFDDAQKDAFVREWADLAQGEYARFQAEGHRDTALESVAERIVEDCRGDFRRAIFVLLSNDRGYLDTVKTQIDKSHEGLALRVELPLPDPRVKESIVRTNTNLLNPRSYWFCLDQGGPEEKKDAYTTLMGERGFLDSFQAISRALAAQRRAKTRTGRPANKNLLTLVTLGTSPSEVLSFLEDHEMVADEHTVGLHLGVWMFRDRWASALDLGPGGDPSRRASLVESEFSLRWIALDMVATQTLCEAPEADPLARRVTDILGTAPSLGASRDARSRDTREIEEIDAALARQAGDPAVLDFGARFTALGQARCRMYEPPIAKRLSRPLSAGLEAWASLKPDIIVHEYEPCAVTSATSADKKAIEVAIKRRCHVIELTAHLAADMRGLDSYLGQKVRVYSDLLESV